MKEAASILLKPEWEWFHDKVYARPNIPRRTLEGAIFSRAPGVPSGEVIVILDDALFGGAKEGLLVTSDAIYCKQKFESPRRMAFKALKQVESGTDSRAIINGHEFFKADLIDHFAIPTFASPLSAVFSLPTTFADAHPDSTRERGVSGVDNPPIMHFGGA